MWQMILAAALFIIGLTVLFKIANWIIKAMVEFFIFLMIAVVVFFVFVGG